MSPNIIGQRLKALRDARGLDQEAVRAILGVGSRQIISQIETGERRVSGEELTRLIEGLDADLDYFTDPYRLEGEGGFCWRQSGRTLADLEDYQRTAGSWIALYRHEAPRVGKPARLTRPKLPLTRQSSFEEAATEGERVAIELGLVGGDNTCPAAGLPDAMEREWGILVLSVDAIEGVSGAACRLPDLDAVLVNRREVVGRRHFDLAHELFHLMTWEQMPPDYVEDPHGFGVKRNRVEQLADNFASALLMPAAVVARFGSWKLGADELVARLNEVADKLQVTAQALKWRLKALGSLSAAAVRGVIDDLLRYNGRQIGGNGWLPPLFSRAFVEVLGAALDKGYLSRRRAARQLGLDLAGLTALFQSHNVDAPDGL